MKDLRLLQIIPSLESGGVEQGTIDIARGVVNKGYASFVMSNGGMLSNKLKKEGSIHYRAPVHSKNPIIMFKNIFKIKQYILKNQINLTHVRSRAPGWSALFATNNKSKLISTFHNVYGHENYLKKIYNTSLAKTDKIIAISSYVKDSIIKLYNINPSKIEIIHRGIDENIFNSTKVSNENWLEQMKKMHIPYDKTIILYPARLTEWKGQIQFLDVMKKLKDDNFFCIFAGDDKNLKYKNKLLKNISKNNLNNHCKLLGHCNNMPLIYKISNIVISAPLKGEGFGRIIAEAMAMKKITISYDFGGASEQIKNLDPDLRVTPLNTEELAEKIIKNINKNIDEKNNITELSRSIVLKNFTKQSMINKTIDLYTKELM